MNILLTSVGRRSYLVRYFKEVIGTKGKVHVSNSSDLTPAFSVADNSVVTPMIYAKEYIPFLISYIKKHDIDVIISLFDIDLPILSKNKEVFEDIGVQLIVSDENVIEICNDKFLTYEFLIKSGFNAPKTYLTVADALSAIENKEIVYPLIVKPRWGMGSIGVLKADNQEELNIFYKKTLAEIRSSYLKYESSNDINKSIVIQEMLNGQEYGLDIINDFNKNYQTTIVKIKHAMRSGETDCAEVVNNPLLKEIGKSLSNKLGHIGNLDVDVFLVDDKPYILEMNARFGGGYPFSHIAGINLPKAIVQWASGKEAAKELFKEKFGVIAHKDISIIKISNREDNVEKSETNIEVIRLESKDDILLALNDFDKVFSPQISFKIESMDDYAEKLFENAIVCVAKKGSEDIGFVTVYANDSIKKIAYIPFIGVKKEYQNMQIGTKLLEYIVEISLDRGMESIKFEVQKENSSALAFYKSNGFSVLEDSSDKSYFMFKKIVGSD